MLGKYQAAFEQDPDGIAAILIEPIQAEGGDHHFRPEFFAKLRGYADRYEALLIFDEVQTGLGVTGTMWAFQQTGVVPDLISFGKKTQVCGMMSTRRIDEIESNVFHVSSRINSTWGGNLVDMVRFRKYLEIIVSENLVENARTTGQYFLEQLKLLAEEFPAHIENVRGRGFMIALDLPNGEARTGFLHTAYGNGMLALGCGERSVRFRPTLDFSKDLVDEAIRITRKSLREVLGGHKTAFAAVEDEAKFEL